MVRVVFDNNVVISWDQSYKTAYHCLELCRRGEAQAATCHPILAELSNTLQFKLDYTNNSIHAIIADLATFVEEVEISGTLHVVKADPNDDMFVECAVVAQADYIVSYDNHLLGLQSYQNIQIITPFAFLDLFGGMPPHWKAAEVEDDV